MRTTFIQLLNVLTREYVTARLVNVNASLIMMVLLVSELSAQISAMKLEFATLNINWPLTLEERIRPHGTPTNMSAVSVILEEEDLIAL